MLIELLQGPWVFKAIMLLAILSLLARNHRSTVRGFLLLISRILTPRMLESDP